MNSFAPLAADIRLAALLDALDAGNTPVAADGLWGSCAPALLAAINSKRPRPVLIITAHADEADEFRDDYETVAGVTPELFPQLEGLPGEGDPSDDLAAERLRVCIALLHARQAAAGGPPIIVAPVPALMQPVPTEAAIRAASRELRVGDRLDPEALAAWLDESGFLRCEQVETPGDFAARGGIIDVFCHAYSDPLRLEFFGDEIESIRLFDAGTQRSATAVHAVTVPAIRPGGGRPGKAAAADVTGFTAYLPPETLIVLVETVEIQELGRSYWQRLGERAGMVPVDALLRRAGDFAQLHVGRLVAGVEPRVSFGVEPLPTFTPKLDESLLALRDLAAEGDVVVLCDNAAEEERFRELLDGRSRETRLSADRPPDAPAPVRFDEHRERIRTAVGVLHRGFRWRPAESQRGADARPVAYVPHHELFSRYRQRRTLRRVQAARPIDSFFDLSPGDFVVHVQHGIGRFRGLELLERSGRREEFLAVEFSGGAVVHTAVSQIHLVQKYIGTHARPRLSSLGGSAWKKTTERVAASVGDLAADLLVVQAQRATQPGLAYPADTLWQREFEGSFLYEETLDQLRAIDEIKADLARSRPMDRLLCGDVGFGKTELAIRAAFKVVEYGKQVAVLVPTTVLAEQHYHTFRERLADYPFGVDVISRFRSKAEQARIVERANRGQIDILIGTHRLLSADVRFSDLGLVVIDEEQRFGVDAKERLKRLRATVDVLTLSATPIPRTLHMAMVGIRDISSLATAPADRRAIVTQVRLWEDGLVRDAIVRELNRDGQTYLVHNFVRDIEQVANRVRTLVPEARVVVGHGQMSGDELEDVMLKFMNREADVLVSTNIIESGIDIPSANTILINRAERFGLADLHQLRGRVGRSKHRAYCYLLLSPSHAVKDQAARRLKAIERYSELGAGFQIAMRDLEIRGAGNMLGPEQSGHIEAVGYEMYCQLLEQAVRRLKHEPHEIYKPVNLDLGAPAAIPRAYIRADRQRMEVYKRLTSCRTIADVHALREELRDTFGPPPEEVQTLLLLGEIRVLAAPLGVRSIVLEPPDVIFAVDDVRRIEATFAQGPGSPRVPDAKTMHWRLPKRLLSGKLLLETLQRQLAGKPGTGP